MSELTMLTGDCRDVLLTLDAGSVQCVVTSPPYLGLAGLSARQRGRAGMRGAINDTGLSCKHGARRRIRETSQHHGAVSVTSDDCAMRRPAHRRADRPGTAARLPCLGTRGAALRRVLRLHAA